MASFRSHGDFASRPTASTLAETTPEFRSGQLTGKPMSGFMLMNSAHRALPQRGYVGFLYVAVQWKLLFGRAPIWLVCVYEQ